MDWSDSLQPITDICILYGSNSGLSVKVSVMAGAYVMEVVKNQTAFVHYDFCPVVVCACVTVRVRVCVCVCVCESE